MKTIYLDNNATTRPAPEVVAAVTDALESCWANPSSIHRAGQAVKRRMELARQSICELIGCRPGELVFTSGGTESINWAVLGSLAAQPDRRILVTSRIEHSAVRAVADHAARLGAEVVWIESDEEGRLDLDQLGSLLERRGDEVALVSLQWANNETGVVQPVETIGSMCRAAGVRCMVDGTQWVGKMPMDLSGMPIDLMAFASHKFHGPKGVGGLFVRRGVRLPSQMLGGAQERERRGGTENVPGIIGMGVAADLARDWLATDGRAEAEARRDRLERGLIDAIPGTIVNSGGAERIWCVANVAFPKVEAEAILLLLSERGVCASAGSACASGSLDPSPVLLAMGMPAARAHGSVRLSICRDTTDEEIDEALAIIPGVVEKLVATCATVA